MARADPQPPPVRLIALYRRPSDEDEFLDRFERVHRPLLEAIPDLRDLRVARVSNNCDSGERGFFLMAEMTFGDQASFARAMCSREHRIAKAALRGFAADPVTLILVGEQREDR